MTNGIFILEKTDTGSTGVYIDQDAVEFARQNARTQKRIRAAEAAQRREEKAHRTAEMEAERRRAYNMGTLKTLAIYSVIIMGAAWGCAAGMIHPAICIPVTVFCLCAACLRLGAWFGKSAK